MSKVINWEITIDIKDDKQYEKLVSFLGKSHLYTFYCEPHFMLESTTVHRVTISCSWTNNLFYLSKWIEKNISDSIDF